MRTTVTLESDVESLLNAAMRERGISFKEAINDAIRAGLRVAPPRRRIRTPTFELGRPTVDVTKALALAAALEDDELVRKLAVGK